MCPAEEDAASGLHQVLPGNDALALVVVLAAQGQGAYMVLSALTRLS